MSDEQPSALSQSQRSKEWSEGRARGAEERAKAEKRTPTRRKCRQCGRHRRISWYRRAGKGGWSRVCLECEGHGFRFCPKCMEPKQFKDFYPNKLGEPTGWCRPCESDRRKEQGLNNVSGTADRKRAMRDGFRPGITPAMKRLFIQKFQETNNVTYASEVAGFSRRTGVKIRDEYLASNTESRGHEAPPDPISWDELSDEARLALEDPGVLAVEYLGLDPLDPWEVEAVWRLYKLYLEAIETGEKRYAVFNAPPGAGKSTTITFVFACFVALRERASGREPTIHLGHRTESKAKWYLRRIRRRLESQKLLHAFGRCKPEGAAPWSNEEIQIEPLGGLDALVEKEPTFSLGSYDKGEPGGRYKLIVWDDLIDKSNSSTAEQRHRLEQDWDQTFEPRLEPAGLVVLSNMRWGPEDLSHYLLSLADEEALGDDGKPLRFYAPILYRAHYEDRCTGEHSPAYPDGCLLTKRITWRDLQMAKRKNEDRFRMMYQQEDTDPSGFLAEREWFEGGKDSRGWLAPGCFDAGRFFGQVREGVEPALSAITIDPSASNYWAIVHFLVYPNGDQFVLQGIRRPLLAPQMLYREQDGEYTGVLEDWYQLALAKGVEPRYVITEERSQQRWLMQYEFAQTWAQERGITLLGHDTNRVNKYDEDRGVETNQRIYQEGRIRFPYGGPEEREFADAFRREACAWPQGNTDDLVMNHWFLTHNLPNLIAGQEDYEPLVETPGWAHVKPPTWAREPAERAVSLTGVPR